MWSAIKYKHTHFWTESIDCCDIHVSIAVEKKRVTMARLAINCLSNIQCWHIFGIILSAAVTRHFFFIVLFMQNAKF